MGRYTPTGRLDWGAGQRTQDPMQGVTGVPHFPDRPPSLVDMSGGTLSFRTGNETRTAGLAVGDRKT
jgi:hypothetical protein